MEENNLFDFFIEQTLNSFKGWDFSHITETGRIDDSPLEWSYSSRILEIIYQRNIKYMLDMGTGGGEFLAKFKKLPPNTYATEGYEPNLPLAKERLNPRGIEVKEVKNDVLKFEDNFFELITNRHESYSVKEVYRVLDKKGIFITQQVGSKNCLEINEKLGAVVDMGLGEWNLKKAITELKATDFNILTKSEEFPILRFYDIGALIYYLKAVPWQVTDFGVDKYYLKLREIHEHIEENNYFEVKEHRFFIIAEK
ncbi:MAG: methyltransferase domain-containing protein [Halanaerobiales bacterium]